MRTGERVIILSKSQIVPARFSGTTLMSYENAFSSFNGQRNFRKQSGRTLNSARCVLLSKHRAPAVTVMTMHSRKHIYMESFISLLCLSHLACSQVCDGRTATIIPKLQSSLSVFMEAILFCSLQCHHKPFDFLNLIFFRNFNATTRPQIAPQGYRAVVSSLSARGDLVLSKINMSINKLT